MPVRSTSLTRIGNAGRHSSARHLAAIFLSGLLSTVTACGSAIAQPTPSLATDEATSFGAHIDAASRRFRIPATWIRHVMRVESAHDMRAVSSAGAMGLMQIMPETWLELRARYGLGDDPFDPRDNILAGTAYLREMYDRYGNVSAMLAAYNAGPKRYDEFLAGTRALPAETRAYVGTIAPLLGAEPPAFTTVSVPADPLAWMSAPLFVMRSDGAQRATDMHRDGQADDVANAHGAQVSDALSTRSPGLFVTRSSDEGRQ